jgi:CRISPR/Cas system endoribonuclease Cas6 (RAMP superfamily)
MLSTFFADGPLDMDFKGLSAVAGQVRLVENHTRMVAVDRRSTRTGSRHDVGGLVGKATYEGAGIAELMALLRVGEVLHVGRHCAFGNGRIAVQ